MTIENIRTLQMIAGNCNLPKAQRDMLTEIVEKEKKYMWRDLINNPDDLPPDNKDVEVKCRCKCKWDGAYRLFTMQMEYRSKLFFAKPIGWGHGYPYDFDFKTDSVIAWREIEPFREEGGTE